MKFVIVFGFFAAIVFNGFNFGQALDVNDAQPALAQLFIDLVNLTGPPEDPAKAQSNAFNNPNRSYATMEDLTAAAQQRFGRYVDYYKQANYYKGERSANAHQALETALNNYENSFTAGTNYPLKSKIFK